MYVDIILDCVALAGGRLLQKPGPGSEPGGEQEGRGGLLLVTSSLLAIRSLLATQWLRGNTRFRSPVPSPNSCEVGGFYYLSNTALATHCALATLHAMVTRH